MATLLYSCLESFMDLEEPGGLQSTGLQRVDTSEVTWHTRMHRGLQGVWKARKPRTFIHTARCSGAGPSTDMSIRTSRCIAQHRFVVFFF